jgi:hypothetical protein
MPKEQVFLSYLREDTHRVEPLIRDLKSSGVAVLDGTRLRPPGVHAAIAESSLFVACFSEHGHNADELRMAFEQLHALEHDRSWLVVVRLAPCEIPPVQITRSMALPDLVIDIKRVGMRLRPEQAPRQIDTTIEIDEMYGPTQTVLGRDIEGNDDDQGSESTRIVVKKMVTDKTAQVVGKRSRVARTGNRRD